MAIPISGFHPMKAKYIGTPGEHLDSISMYGYDFPKGKFVEVTDPHAVRKLSQHPHFESKDDPRDAAEDVQIKREFEAIGNAALQPIEENKVEEAKTQAALTDEDKYGSDPEPAGDKSSAEAVGTRGKRVPKSS